MDSGATFAGNATFGGAGTVAGTLAPGNGPGTLAFSGSLSLTGSSRVQWELGGNAIAGASQVNAGTTTIAPGVAVNVVLNNSGSVVDFSNRF